MSHLSRGRCKIKDLFTLREVAKSMGLKVVEKKKLHGSYIGTIDCEFVLTDRKGGELAVVQTGNEEYEIQMDNYYNSICEVVGDNGGKLTRDYMTEVHKKEVQLLGGIIASCEVDVQGFVYLEVAVP